MAPIGISGEMKRNVLAFILGLLIEWNGLKEIFKLNTKVNWLIIPAMFLGIIGFIPTVNLLQWFGVGWRGLKDGTIHILMVPESSVIVLVLAGILLIRSLTPVPTYK